MESIENKILKSLKKCGRGTVFFADRFARLGNADRLHKAMDKPFAAEALRDDALWESIRHHRQVSTSVSDIDYTPDMRERMVLVPRADIVESWKRDYATC